MIQVAVPSDRLALAIVADNALRDGDRVEPPWIVHADGTRDRLFTRLGFDTTYRGFLCWESRLDNIFAAEQLFARCVDRNLAAWARAWEIVAQIKAVGGKAHAKPRGRGYGGKWWEWRVRDNDALGWEWIARPSPVLHGDLGRELYRRHEYAYRTTAKHASQARDLFVGAVRKHIRKHRTFARLLRLSINGHDYLWNATERSRLDPIRLYGEPGNDPMSNEAVYAEVSL